jgi:hypothetical protein
MLVQHKVVFCGLFFAVPVLGADAAKCLMRRSDAASQAADTVNSSSENRSCSKKPEVSIRMSAWESIYLPGMEACAIFA